MPMQRGYSSPSLSTIRTTLPAVNGGGISRQSSRTPLAGGWRHWTLSLLLCAAALSVITLLVNDTVQISRYYFIMQHKDVSYEMVVHVPRQPEAGAGGDGAMRPIYYRPLLAGSHDNNRGLVRAGDVSNVDRIVGDTNLQRISDENFINGTTTTDVNDTKNISASGSNNNVTVESVLTSVYTTLTLNDNSSNNTDRNNNTQQVDNSPVPILPPGKLDKWGKPRYSADYRAVTGAPPLNGYNFTLTPRCDSSDPCSCCSGIGANPNRSRDGCPALLLIVVVALPDNFMRRDLIRRTYANLTSFRQSPNLTIRTIFILGTPANDSTGKLRAKFEAEWEKHGDLLQGDFIDSYANLSLKSAALLHWANNYCSHASYVLKIDSDVFLNTPNLISYIEQIESNITRDGNQSTLVQPVFHCRWQEKDYVIRAWRKNNVSMEAYSMGYYPPYCSGYAYLMNIQALRVIAAQAQNASYFANEDVLVTGFLALRAGVRHVDILPQYLNYPYVEGSYDFPAQCKACIAMTNINNYIFAHAQLYAYWSQMWTYMTTSNSTEREDINAECISTCPMY